MFTNFICNMVALCCDFDFFIHGWFDSIYVFYRLIIFRTYIFFTISAKILSSKILSCKIDAQIFHWTKLTFRKLLIFTENSLPVNKLADMINRPNAKWIAPKGTALESFIKVHIHCVRDYCAHLLNFWLKIMVHNPSIPSMQLGI